MCQESNSRKFVKTTEDIVVYKQFKYSGGKYTTPYRGAEYIIGKTYKVSLFKIKLDFIMNNMFRKRTFRIFYGLHSFINCQHPFNYRNGEFIIPKGSYVNYGDFAGYNTVVSNALVFNKVLN